jgi:hypothetical protein
MKKIIHIMLIATASVLFTGCAATRTISDVSLGAGGAALGGTLSKNNPAAIAGGAAAGVLLSEGINYGVSVQQKKAYQTGYDKGRSDAVKQQYWLYVDMQKKSDRADHVRLYEIQLPEQRIDGVLFNPTTKYLRIEE